MDFLSVISIFLLIGTFVLKSDCCLQKQNISLSGENTTESVNEPEKTKTTISTNAETLKFILYYKNATEVESSFPLVPTSSSSTECELKIGNLASFKNCGFNAEENSMILIIHGFLAQPMVIFPIRDEYLKYNFKNVIALDWRKLAGSILPIPLSFASYFWVQKNVPRASDRVVQFLSFMIENDQLKDLTGVHIVGHSIGAHLAGSIGHLAQKKLELKVGRVTGLDPAGPFLNLQKPEDRLSPTAGSFVDALHTDSALEGTPKPLAQADFYANGGLGYNQDISNPKCFFPKNTTFYMILYYLTPIPIACPHTISIRYFAQTIPNKKNDSGQIVPINKYRACPCNVGKNPRAPCPKFQPSCPNETLFGEYVDTNVQGKYYVKIKFDD